MGYIEGIMISACINIVCVAGLAILTGYTGLFSMGHACFLCLGAYTAGILTKFFGVPYLIALLAGGGTAALFSLVIGIPTLRGKMSADCFTIATFGFGEATRVVMANINHPYVGGALGLSGLNTDTTLPKAIVIAAIAVYFARNYAKSQHGKLAIAVRDHADASELIGVNIFHEKLKALAISAFFCGVGGGMMAHYYTYIVPNIFGGTMSTNLLTAVVLGGVCSVTGPVLATSVLTATPEVLRFMSNWRLPMYGLVLILTMRIRPEGLMGYRELSVRPLIRRLRKKAGKHSRDKEVQHGSFGD
ncbi:MAG: branched-chain amino acid ABC transporter permease [Lachnospiraceae bacterium]|jgi:branched-chain amino acid transport system permease protein|nr:branched-chain amino acid ABC transporter permease [Lachnospiraceae bacterium]